MSAGPARALRRDYVGCAPVASSKLMGGLLAWSLGYDIRVNRAVDDEMAEAQAEYFALFQELAEQHRQRLADGLEDARPAATLKEMSLEEEEACAKEIAEALEEPLAVESFRESIVELRAMLAERG